MVLFLVRDQGCEATLEPPVEFHQDNADGTQTMTWLDTDENIAFAKAALQALAKPLPGEDGERDPRPAPVRNADAMVDLIRRSLDAGAFDPARGVRPHLHVIVNAETMRSEPGAPPRAPPPGTTSPRRCCSGCCAMPR